MKVRCIAVDDEPFALEKIKGFVERVDTFDLIGSFSNAIDALSFLRENIVDVIFLDVQMEELTGLQMIESLEEKPVIILTTAYDKYSIRGFDLNVTDYLLKPYSFMRFLQSVNKAYDALSIKRKNKPVLISRESAEPGQEFIFVKSEGKLVKLDFNDILFIEGMKDYVRIHAADKSILSIQSLSKLEEIFSHHNFVRIHRSYIVSINKIEAIQKRSVVIKGHTLPIGDSFRKHFLMVMDKGGIIL